LVYVTFINENSNRAKLAEYQSENITDIYHG